MVKKFKKLRDFVSKNKKYLSLYLFLIGISNVIDGHTISESKDYDDYTLFAIRKADNDYPILSRLLRFSNYILFIQFILDIRNKSNHFVNGYLINSLGRSLFVVIQNIINPINKLFPIIYIYL